MFTHRHRCGLPYHGTLTQYEYARAHYERLLVPLLSILRLDERFEDLLVAGSAVNVVNTMIELVILLRPNIPDREAAVELLIDTISTKLSDEDLFDPIVDAHVGSHVDLAHCKPAKLAECARAFNRVAAETCCCLVHVETHPEVIWNPSSLCELLLFAMEHTGNHPRLLNAILTRMRKGDQLRGPHGPLELWFITGAKRTKEHSHDNCNTMLEYLYDVNSLYHCSPQMDFTYKGWIISLDRLTTVFGWLCKHADKNSSAFYMLQKFPMEELMEECVTTRYVVRFNTGLEDACNTMRTRGEESEFIRDVIRALSYVTSTNIFVQSLIDKVAAFSLVRLMKIAPDQCVSASDDLIHAIGPSRFIRRPFLFAHVCEGGNMELVEHVYKEVRDCMDDMKITLANSTPPNSAYNPQACGVTCAFKHNTPDVCAFLLHEAKRADPEFAAAMLKTWSMGALDRNIPVLMTQTMCKRA